jgi:endonuclease YncB( thermonuclease family)
MTHARTLTVLALLLLVSPALARDIRGPAFVVDGDTVTVAVVSVRLKGVDASERNTPRGEAARRAMQSIVSGEIRCELTGEKTWGRPLPGGKARLKSCPTSVMSNW